jgi:hypothetical protein
MLNGMKPSVMSIQYIANIVKLIPKLSVFGHKSNSLLRSSFSATTPPTAELDDICGTVISKINIVITTAKIPSVRASILFLLRQHLLGRGMY